MFRVHGVLQVLGAASEKLRRIMLHLVDEHSGTLIFTHAGQGAFSGGHGTAPVSSVQNLSMKRVVLRTRSENDSESIHRYRSRGSRKDAGSILEICRI